MNYNKIYNNLIERGKNRILDCYVEKHHIIPRCMGGGDEFTNIVELTPSEHYVSHQLLLKIYRLPSLYYATKMMCNGLKHRNNKLYGWIRIEANKHMSDSIKNKWATKYGFIDYLDQCQSLWDMYIIDKMKIIDISKKMKIPVANIQRSINHYSIIFNLNDILKMRRTEIRVTESIIIRNSFTNEQELNRINSCKNVDYTERNKKMSKMRNGSKNPVYGKHWTYKKEICPHCKLLTSSKRWHFNNCRNKNENCKNR